VIERLSRQIRSKIDGRSKSWHCKLCCVSVANSKSILLQRAALLRALARSAAGGKIGNLICVFRVPPRFFVAALRFCAHGAQRVRSL
jgi:hypothetical protein